MNSTDTQREAYAIVHDSGKVANEQRIVLVAMQKLTHPVSRLTLSQITGLPQNHLTRVLYDLRYPKPPKEPLVKVPYKAKCPKTNMRVQHYQLIRKEGGSDD